MRRRTTLAAAAGFAVVATFAVATPAARAAAPPPAQQWTEVQALLGGIRGVWTAQDYAGAVSRNMPNTALLGNGDIGVTSGGGDGFNTGSVTDRTIASVDLNTDAALRGTWTTILQRLAPIPTTVHNGRTVYALGDAGTFSGGDTRPIHPGDNTVNLEFIHPGEALGIRSPAADRQRAIDTVNAMNSWWQDNSFPKVFTQAARVGYPGQTIIDQLKGQITGKSVANLRVYDPFHGLEKAGAIEAVNNLLLQSDDGVMRVFPVWPASRNASFVNLREKDAFLVSSSLQGGQIQYVDIASQAGRQARLQHPWPGRNVVVNRVGAGTVSHAVSGDVISFATQAGATYTVTPV